MDINRLDLIECKPSTGTYQPRKCPEAAIVIGKSQRHCYNCNGIIPKGVKHMRVISHIATSYRNDQNFCKACVMEMVKQL